MERTTYAENIEILNLFVLKTSAFHKNAPIFQFCLYEGYRMKSKSRDVFCPFKKNQPERNVSFSVPTKMVLIVIFVHKTLKKGPNAPETIIKLMGENRKKKSVQNQSGK